MFSAHLMKKEFFHHTDIFSSRSHSFSSSRHIICVGGSIDYHLDLVSQLPFCIWWRPGPCFVWLSNKLPDASLCSDVQIRHKITDSFIQTQARRQIPDKTYTCSSAVKGRYRLKLHHWTKNSFAKHIETLKEINLCKDNIYLYPPRFFFPAYPNTHKHSNKETTYQDLVLFWILAIVPEPLWSQHIMHNSNMGNSHLVI